MNGPTLTIAVSPDVQDVSPVLLMVEQDDQHIASIYLTLEEASRLADSLSTAVGLTRQHVSMLKQPTKGMH